MYTNTNGLNEHRSLQQAVTTGTSPTDSSTVPAVFEQKKIKEIHIESIKTKKTKTFTNANDLKIFAVSMENAKKNSILLDEEGADLIDYNMWMTFQDGSYKRYYIWVIDGDHKDIIIGYQSHLEELNLQLYQLTEEHSKEIDALLQDNWRGYN